MAAGVPSARTWESRSAVGDGTRPPKTGTAMTTKSSGPKASSRPDEVTSRNSAASHRPEAMCSAIFFVPPVGEK